MAVAGSVGNQPKVHNMDISFPTTGIKAEATPNTEMILIVDVDLSLLKELHEKGSVRTKKDRRTALYDVISKK